MERQLYHCQPKCLRINCVELFHGVERFRRMPIERSFSHVRLKVEGNHVARNWKRYGIFTTLILGRAHSER